MFPLNHSICSGISFLYSNRKDRSDYDRFRVAASQIVGKHLSWNEAPRKNHEPQTRSIN